MWGAAGSGAERLWAARDAREFESGGEIDPKLSLETEFGYGFEVPGTSGVVTAYTGLSLIEAGGRTWRTGTRWNIAPGAVMGIERT